MDITDTLAPDSDQLDAVELAGGPRTFTIERVSQGKAEQPVNVHMVGFPRPWRPGKSMRRVLAACWGTDASTWAGRKVTLYCDPNVMFGKDKVGGTRISHLSHISEPKKVSLLVSRGKAALFTVQPLVETATPAAQSGPDLKQLASAFKVAGITEKQAMLDYCRKLLDRDITAATDLSGEEVARVVDALKADVAEGGESA